MKSINQIFKNRLDILILFLICILILMVVVK